MRPLFDLGFASKSWSWQLPLITRRDDRRGRLLLLQIHFAYCHGVLDLRTIAIVAEWSCRRDAPSTPFPNLPISPFETLHFALRLSSHRSIGSIHSYKRCSRVTLQDAVVEGFCGLSSPDLLDSIAGIVLQRPGAFDAQAQIERRILTGHPIDHACCVDVQVRQWRFSV